MSKVTHLHSRITTLLEAARLVRRRFEDVGPTVFDTNWIDADTMLGACGIASYTLSAVLRRVGVKCDFVMGRFFTGRDRGEHCWVEVPGESLIIDLTATQFDIPSTVHVTSLTDTRYHERSRNKKAVEELRNWAGQSHLQYEDVLQRIIDDVSVELTQSGFVARAA